MVKGFREAANQASMLLENKTMINTGNPKGDFLIALVKKVPQAKRKANKPTKPVSIRIVRYVLCVLP